MIRITHLTGSLQGTAVTSPKAVIRIGRGADCDVRFDSRLDTRVSLHHAEIRFDTVGGGYYQVVDVGSSNGTLVNGKLVRQQKLRSGDKIVFGAQGGPEVKFEIDDNAFVNSRRPPPQMQGYAPQPMAQPSGENVNYAEEAQQRIAQAR